MALSGVTWLAWWQQCQHVSASVSMYQHVSACVGSVSVVVDSEAVAVWQACGQAGHGPAKLAILKPEIVLN